LTLPVTEMGTRNVSWV